jgi:hypothetical protein
MAKKGFEIVKEKFGDYLLALSLGIFAYAGVEKYFSKEFETDNLVAMGIAVFFLIVGLFLHYNTKEKE